MAIAPVSARPVDPLARATRGGRDFMTIAAGGVLAILVFAGIAGQFGLFGDPQSLGSGSRLAPPSWGEPFGTDELGRSTLPRVADAIGNTMLVALISVAISTFISVLLAAWSGYLKGPLDRGVVAFANLLFAFPSLLFAILLAAVLGPGRPAAIAATVIITLPLSTLVYRRAAASVAERDFVVSAEISGVPAWRIVATHIIPNIGGPIAVQSSFALSVAMLVESGLSFLGLGVQPPSASLGSLVFTGLGTLAIAPWLVFIPGAVLTAAIVSANLLGDGLRDRLEPREVRSLR